MLWWSRSSFCDSGSCVEVCLPDEGSPFVLVRQSQWTSGEVLKFTPEEWRDFVAGAKNGEFDL